MVFDSLRARMGGRDNLTPMQIAQHSLFTAREKLELLNDLKIAATNASSDPDDVRLDPEEIDSAIAHVRQGAADGVGTQTVLKGDY